MPNQVMIMWDERVTYFDLADIETAALVMLEFSETHEGRDLLSVTHKHLQSALGWSAGYAIKYTIAARKYAIQEGLFTDVKLSHEL